MNFSALAGLIDRHSPGDGVHVTRVPGMHCLKLSGPEATIPTVYQPSFCVIAQGSKKVILEGEIHSYAPSQFLVVSVDLPLVGQAVEATPDRPYLCLQLNLDAHQLSELVAQIDQKHTGEGESSRGLFVGNLDEALMASVLRLAGLLESPADIPLLAPMMIREVYYRILRSPQGPRIAQIAVAGSRMQRIAQVLRTMKTDFTKAVRVEDLADMANMSPSSFHFHFKEVTRMTPLQYQKRLRLLEARRIMLAEAADASSTAYRVGYESASQFSREYARMFGAPPIRDVESLRQVGQVV